MIAGQKVRLRAKRLADAQDDYAWQRDAELAGLDAVPRLSMSYTRYLMAYVFELRFASAGRCQFAIDAMDGTHIGNCVYYGINEAEGEAELGIMIGKRVYWGKGYGYDAVTALVSHIFGETNLKRIYLKTLESNSRAQKCFRNSGFKQCGRTTKDGYKFILMEINRKQWEEESQSSEAEDRLEGE